MFEGVFIIWNCMKKDSQHRIHIINNKKALYLLVLVKSIIFSVIIITTNPHGLKKILTGHRYNYFIYTLHVQKLWPCVVHASSYLVKEENYKRHCLPSYLKEKLKNSQHMRSSYWVREYIPHAKNKKKKKRNLCCSRERGQEVSIMFF